MKPNKNFIKKWVKALRSRKFKQCRSNLRNENKHCCIGVACELLEFDKPGNIGFYINNFYTNTTIPTEIWEEKTGLLPAVQEELVNMNDTAGKKFYQIANYLERKFLK